MNVFTMVVLIVAICVFGDVMKKRSKGAKGSNKELEQDLERLVSINEKMNNKVMILEERVANLETIVTQEGYDLKSKINSL